MAIKENHNTRNANMLMVMLNAESKGTYLFRKKPRF
jgi:hypothetical protein